MKCPCCPKEYQSKNDMERHLKKIHGLSVAKIRPTSSEEQSAFVKQCLEVMDEMEKKTCNHK